MLAMAQQVQLRAQDADNGVAFLDLGAECCLLQCEFCSLICNDGAQGGEFILAVEGGGCCHSKMIADLTR